MVLGGYQFLHIKSLPLLGSIKFCNEADATVNQITCITQISLDTWQSMSADEIHSRIPGAPGAKKRFLAALKRFTKFKEALSTFLRLQTLDAIPRSDIVAPTWDGNKACFHGGKLIQFSVEPRNLTRNCPASATLPDSVSSEWLLRFDAITAAIRRITELL